MPNAPFPSIAFVHTPCPDLEDDRLEPPLGILSLATLIKKIGLEVRIHDLSGMPETKWEAHLPKADIIGFSTYSQNYQLTLDLLRRIRDRYPTSLMIAGGPHASALPFECAKDFDVVVVGEGENAILNLLRGIRQGKRRRGILRAPVVNNLDILPHSDFDLVDLSSYHRVVEGLPSLSVMTSRGCPYQCTFCNSRVFTRGKLRFRSVKHVVSELRELMRRYGTQTFRFNDDLFTFSPARIREMTEAIGPLHIRYRVFGRANSLTKDACRALFESGCRHVAIGIESMSERMLGLLEKGVTPAINRTAMSNAKAAGLTVRIYLLVGFPGETIETVQETLRAIRSCDFDEFIVYPFIPYPGTAVWERPEAYGARLDRNLSSYVQVGRNRKTAFVVATEDFTPAMVEQWRVEMIAALEERVTWAGRSPLNR